MSRFSKKTLALMLSLVFLLCSFSVSASFCEHSGGDVVSSTQIYTKIDDVKHSITNIVERKCAKCGDNYEVIDAMGNETHYHAYTADGGHGSGKTHYMQQICVCDYYQIISFICPGPPCLAINPLAFNASLGADNISPRVYTSRISEEYYVEELVSQLFERKLDALRMQPVEVGALFTVEGQNNAPRAYDQAYFSNKLEYLQELYSFSSRVPDSHSLSIRIISTAIDGTQASVVVEEEIEFQYADCDEMSGERYYYQIDLNKESGNWLIQTIRSTDSFDEMYYDTGFQSSTLIEEVNEAKRTLEFIERFAGEMEPSNNETSSYPLIADLDSSLSFTSYDANSAASYAATYALDYNANFRSYNGNGGDCQNFASQCLWYGFGGNNISSNISNGDFPMVTSGSGTWYQKGQDGASTSSWINVDGFALLINESSATRAGPQGSYTNSEYKKCDKGDLLAYYTTDSSDYTHVYFVYRVTGTANNRTPSNIYLSAHTDDIHNVSLADIWGVSVAATKFRTIKITGYYG